MKQFELLIKILNKDYVDDLIVALARQGHSPYLNEEEGVVGIVVGEEDLTEFSYEKVSQ